MITELKTAPTGYPVTLKEAKDHLRVHQGIVDQDDYISGLITVATEAAESFTKRRFISQTWIGYLSSWPAGSYFELPFGALQSVTAITYKDQDGNASAWGPSKYIVDTASTPGRVVLAYGESWPSGTLYPSNPIAVEFICGYGNAAAVPERIKQAMKIFITDLFNNPESLITAQGAGSAQKLKTFEALLWPHRVWMKG